MSGGFGKWVCLHEKWLSRRGCCFWGVGLLVLRMRVGGGVLGVVGGATGRLGGSIGGGGLVHRV